jgi:hypothetical protein
MDDWHSSSDNGGGRLAAQTNLPPEQIKKTVWLIMGQHHLEEGELQRGEAMIHLRHRGKLEAMMM